MAKTLAQGRKPGSGRKPGKGKTLREGRKPGSGRRRRVDEEATKIQSGELHGVEISNECILGSLQRNINNELSTRDMEAVDALRGLNTSPSQQHQQLLTPESTATQFKSMLSGMESTRPSQDFIDLNRNLSFTNGFLYAKSDMKPDDNHLMESNVLTGLTNTSVPVGVPVAISHSQETKSHERSSNANQNINQTNGEKVLILT